MRNILALAIVTVLTFGLVACKSGTFDFPPEQGGYTAE
jgi:hypothetical protein